jgi:hypothetical protein
MTKAKPGGGWYHFPAVMPLLTIVDVVGSIHKGERGFGVKIDAKRRATSIPTYTGIDGTANLSRGRQANLLRGRAHGASW